MTRALLLACLCLPACATVGDIQAIREDLAGMDARWLERVETLTVEARSEAAEIAHEELQQGRVEVQQTADAAVQRNEDVRAAVSTSGTVWISAGLDVVAAVLLWYMRNQTRKRDLVQKKVRR